MQLALIHTSADFVLLKANQGPTDLTEANFVILPSSSSRIVLPEHDVCLDLQKAISMYTSIQGECAYYGPCSSAQRNHGFWTNLGNYIILCAMVMRELPEEMQYSVQYTDTVCIRWNK